MTNRLFNSPPPMGWLFKTIVSGGQTGADRAALDWAIGQNIAHGGWCPSGRMATDGPLASEYMLRETESTGYRQRTKLTVQDSDATLIFNSGVLDGGTLQTVRFAQKLKKPHRIFQLDGGELTPVAQQVADWLMAGQFAVLNIAGPREEKRPGIYAVVFLTLSRVQSLSSHLSPHAA